MEGEILGPDLSMGVTNRPGKLPPMPATDGAHGQLGAASQPGREFGSSTFLASLALAGSFAALGLNSISISRIEGADGAGLIALSTQFVFLATFVAGGGLRTSVTYRVGGGLWSPRSAVRGALLAAVCLGAVGAALGLGLYAALRHSALRDFNLPMVISLMGALPFALAWWILPAIPLARERYETYALLTVSGPICVLLSCPGLALVAGRTGAVIGFAGGWALGGTIATMWSIRFSRTREAGVGPTHGLRQASGFGARAWVNDLFQLINLRPDLFILTAYYGASDTGVYAVTVSITSLVWIVSQPLASVVLPRSARVTAGVQPALGPMIPIGNHAIAVRHAVLVSVGGAIAVIPILALAPFVWGPGFQRTLGLGLILLPGVALLGVGRVMVAAFTGEGAANEALLVGLVSFPLTFAAFLLVIPDHGSTGAAIVSCCSYIVASALAAYLYFRAPGHSWRSSLIPRADDLRDYVRLARQGLDGFGRWRLRQTR
jgi:O-antigen/teichoic acid export membrane protein